MFCLCLDIFETGFKRPFVSLLLWATVFEAAIKNSLCVLVGKLCTQNQQGITPNPYRELNDVVMYVTVHMKRLLFFGT